MTNIHSPPASRVFLSYARDDDETFVKRLHADLTAAGFTVWFDRESLMSRGLTFHHEIKDAIRTEVDRVVYVGGPKAALSAYVREEWQFALECDQVVVTPILRLGDYETCVPGELGLLHCEDFRDDALYPAALAKLIAYLRQPNPKLGALFAVPNLPPHFLGRPDLMRRVRDALLVDLQKPQVITSADAKVGMQGMGGIGKSVLAAALARNREVRQSYPDGIIWISCGQKLTRDDLLARLRDVAKDLGGDTGFDSIPQGQGVLRELLQAKAVLLVLDDVWQSSDAQTFDLIGPRCRMLVTTRDAGILHALHGELVPVSLFTEPEALQLLADAVGCGRSALPPEALEVVRECGCLPLAVALSGGMAKKRGGDFHNVLERLHRADLDKIADRASINEQHSSIWRAMQASVEVLSEDEQRRFAELSVFATDRPVPEAAVATLWSHTGHLDCLDAEDLLINLAERSLVRLEETPGSDGKLRRRVSLHDLLHDYAVRVAGEPQALHQSLVDAYRKKCPDGWHTGPNDGFYFQNLAHHLWNAGCAHELKALLNTYAWVLARLNVSSAFETGHDYDYLDSADELQLIRKAIELSSHVLASNVKELPSQLVGRLAPIDIPVVKAFLDQAEGATHAPWLRPLRSTLHSPWNALVRFWKTSTAPKPCRLAWSADERQLGMFYKEGEDFWDLGNCSVLDAKHADSLLKSNKVNLDGLPEELFEKGREKLDWSHTTSQGEASVRVQLKWNPRGHYTDAYFYWDVICQCAGSSRTIDHAVSRNEEARVMLCACLSTDGSLAACAGRNGEFRVYETSSLNVIHEGTACGADIVAIGMSPSKRLLAIFTRDGYLGVVDLKMDTREWHAGPSLGDTPKDLYLSPQCGIFIGCTIRGDVGAFDYRTGKVVAQFPFTSHYIDKLYSADLFVSKDYQFGVLTGVGPDIYDGWYILVFDIRRQLRLFSAEVDPKSDGWGVDHLFVADGKHFLKTVRGPAIDLSTGREGVPIDRDGKIIDWAKKSPASKPGLLCKAVDNSRVLQVECSSGLITFTPDEPITRIVMAEDGNTIAVACQSGRLHFLESVNFPPCGPAILTATNASSARCPYCARDFPPAHEVTAAINAHAATLSPGQSSCLDLPDSAFDDPRLLTACPHCAKPLKFNPFFVASNP